MYCYVHACVYGLIWQSLAERIDTREVVSLHTHLAYQSYKHSLC